MNPPSGNDSTPPAPPAASQTYRPGRTLGVVVRDTTRDKGYIFLRDETGEEYFAHVSAFPGSNFDDFQTGDAVTFRVTETTKGARAWDVDRANVEEQEAVHAWAENRGNR